MKPVPAEVLHTLARSFAFDPTALQQIGGGRIDSDGVVYAAGEENRKRVLKITHHDRSETHALPFALERTRFFAYLGANGVPVTNPQPSASGKLIESCLVGDDHFLAYNYPFLRGTPLKADLWDDALLQSWGALIGKTHRLTKDYEMDQTLATAMNWEFEVASFVARCPDEEIKEVWWMLRNEIRSVGQSKDIYGMVHNDPHMENLLLDEGRLSLIDLDVSLGHFFACDLAIAIQSVLFTKSGGMSEPLRDQEALDYFVTQLLTGYRRENTLSKVMTAQINTFIKYRRVLLFTVMYSWLLTKPELFSSWKDMIMTQPTLLNRVLKKFR